MLIYIEKISQIKRNRENLTTRKFFTQVIFNVKFSRSMVQGALGSISRLYWFYTLKCLYCVYIYTKLSPKLLPFNQTLLHGDATPSSACARSGMRNTLTHFLEILKNSQHSYIS